MAAKFGGENPLRLVRKIVELRWSALALERVTRNWKPETGNSKLKLFFVWGRKRPAAIGRAFSLTPNS
jgi:hypothetical protein